jgi:hypothetical protein
MLAKLDRLTDDWFGFIGAVTLAALTLTYFTGHINDAWVWPTFGTLAALAAAYITASTLSSERKRRRYQRSLPDLTDWDLARQDPRSGIWRISPPCGYENWNLFAPGSGLPDQHGFITGEPTAQHPATGDAAEHDDEPHNPETFQAWAIPWIEQVSGGHVAELVVGWGAPYGEHKDLYEWSAFARVTPAGEAETGPA